MSDRPQSTPRPRATTPQNPTPPPPRPLALPEQLAFRETFLWRFHRPEVVDAFRLVGDALFDLLNEAGAWGPRSDYPTTCGELQAACDDLDHLAGYLEDVANERYASELDPVAEALAESASAWSGRLSRLVVDMRQALTGAAQALDAGTEETQG